MQRRDALIATGGLAVIVIYFSVVNYQYLKGHGPFYVNLAASFAASLLVILLAELFFGENSCPKKYN